VPSGIEPEAQRAMAAVAWRSSTSLPSAIELVEQGQREAGAAVAQRALDGAQGFDLLGQGCGRRGRRRRRAVRGHTRLRHLARFGPRGLLRCRGRRWR